MFNFGLHLRHICNTVCWPYDWIPLMYRACTGCAWLSSAQAYGAVVPAPQALPSRRMAPDLVLAVRSCYSIFPHSCLYYYYHSWALHIVLSSQRASYASTCHSHALAPANYSDHSPLAFTKRAGTILYYDKKKHPLIF